MSLKLANPPRLEDMQFLFRAGANTIDHINDLNCPQWAVSLVIQAIKTTIRIVYIENGFPIPKEVRELARDINNAALMRGWNRPLVSC
jgi:hypothetical protein